MPPPSPLRQPAARLTPDSATVSIRSVRFRGASLLLRASAEKVGVEWSLEVRAPLPLVLADRAQLEQAFLNIAKNAIEAAGLAGRVAVRAAATSERVDVLVENTSDGIDDEVQARLFTPFFSTKADGRGLDLTLVREILVHHGAPFSLSAPKGGPTRFTFSLKPRPTSSTRRPS